MAPLAITRWVLARTLRSPLGWLLLAVGAFTWPALLRFAPIGISTGSADSAALAFEVAFLGLLLGAWRGLLALESIEPSLALAANTTRLRAEAATLFLSALAWGLLVSLWPLALGAVGEGGALQLGLALLVGAAHLSALGLLLLRWRVPAGVRSLGLLLLAWGIPSLAGTSTLAGRWLSTLLDVAATLRPDQEGWSPTALAVRLAPILGLGLAALSLRVRDTHRPPRPS